MPRPPDRLPKFAPLQTHVKGFEIAIVAFAIACAVAILVIVLATGLGNPHRP
jgi:hypothetical protein